MATQNALCSCLCINEFVVELESEKLTEEKRREDKLHIKFACRCRMEPYMALKSFKELLQFLNFRKITAFLMKIWTLISYLLKRNMRTVGELR